MSPILLGCVVAMATLIATVSGTVSLEGAKIVQLRQKQEDGEAFDKMINQLSADDNVDILSIGPGVAEIMVAFHHVHQVAGSIKDKGFDVRITVRDVERFLAKDYGQTMAMQRTYGLTDVTHSYLGLEEIKQFLQTVKDNAKLARVRVTSLGQSFEGKDMPEVVITEKGKGKKRKGRKKPAILIDAGIHAREWIAPAMALNIINKLALNPDNDPDVPKLLSMFNWHIAPLINPDGYEFSRLKAVNRLWRKTRTDKHKGDTDCIGVDANRNFGFDWNPNEGASQDPCAQDFAGPSAFSEPETRNVRDWLKKLSDKTALFLTLHSFGQFVLYPPGFNPNRTLDNQDVFDKVAKAFGRAMNNTGLHYLYGNSAKLLYPASGTTMDYAWGGAAIPLSYTIELSPSIYDKFPENNLALGFLYPAEKLPAMVDATWSGLKAMFRAVYESM